MTFVFLEYMYALILPLANRKRLCLLVPQRENKVVVASFLPQDTMPPCNLLVMPMEFHYKLVLFLLSAP